MFNFLSTLLVSVLANTTFVLIIFVLTIIVLISKVSLAETSKPAIVNPEQLYRGLSAGTVPMLSAKGEFSVGVQTLTINNPAQLNINTGEIATRSLRVEVWYPATKPEPDSNIQTTTYENETRTGKPFSIIGSAFRDAKILPPVVSPHKNSQYPLVVLSHGYTGYRTLMFYLGEHLASHGYIVASIDHTDSTNADVDIINTPYSGFLSTLYNRSRDQQFTLNYFTTQPTFISKAVDQNSAGLLGYSMGGYGAINTIGGCYQFTEKTVQTFSGIKDTVQVKTLQSLLNSCAGGQMDNKNIDPRWKAAIAIAPWGNQHDIFNLKDLAQIKSPVLYIAGELDDVSDYVSIQKMFKNTGSKNRYLLSLVNARHNIAGHPAPLIARNNEKDLGHYLESAWDTEQLNNIIRHFTLAMMNCYIKEQSQACDFIKLNGNSDQRVTNEKTPPPWKGFPNRYSTGMKWNNQ